MTVSSMLLKGNDLTTWRRGAVNVNLKRNGRETMQP